MQYFTFSNIVACIGLVGSLISLLLTYRRFKITEYPLIRLRLEPTIFNIALPLLIENKTEVSSTDNNLNVSIQYKSIKCNYKEKWSEILGLNVHKFYIGDHINNLLLRSSQTNFTSVEPDFKHSERRLKILTNEDITIIVQAFLSWSPSLFINKRFTRKYEFHLKPIIDSDQILICWINIKDINEYVDAVDYALNSNLIALNVHDYLQMNINLLKSDNNILNIFKKKLMRL
jgi:hypothetical protein